jgi:RNA polymerase sigma-70 factor (ECF subfamily)
MSVDVGTGVKEPDLELLARFTATGDAAAFAEIVQRYARVVYSASVRILGDDARAQDVSQETFFRLMRQPRIVTHSLGGWLHRSATHLAMDVRRSERARRQREITYTAEQLQLRQAEPTWAEISPYVDEALNDIAEPTRSLLIRHFLQGVQQADLAVELGTSPATISRRIKSGVELLQQQLRKKGIYVGVGVLATFCVSHTGEAAPVTFLSEMGKMNLIASVRDSLGPPGPPATYPPPYKMRPKPVHVPPSKWLIAGVSLAVTAYVAVVIVTWDRSMPASPQTTQQAAQPEPHTEPQPEPQREALHR